MKKLVKKDYVNLLLILLPIIGLIIYLLVKGYIFGSEVDWANQYITIPDYFRSNFYKTGQLFPKLALNIGMGQNIFYFSYYGLLSPIVLLSYLLPFIPMSYYIMSISIIFFSWSIYLFYKWINNKYDSKVAFISTFLLAFNSIYFYHFHRHIMFVIYMPFLILALNSVDNYLDNNKKIPLIIFTFLMIMTSYYFSVFGIITIGIYTLYRLCQRRKIKIKPLLNIVKYVLISIFLSGIIILPTIYAIKEGRIESNFTSLAFKTLINPKTNYEYTFYFNYYSWGLSLIYILAVIYGFISKKIENILLSSISTLFIILPLISYIFNGLMYIDGKCFIPYLPIIILQVSELIKMILKKKINYSKLISIFLPVSVIICFLSIGNSTFFLQLLDFTLILISLFILKNSKKSCFIYIPIIIISLISFTIRNTQEKYLTIDDLNNINNPNYYKLSNIDMNNIYRISFPDNTLYTPNKVYHNNYITPMYSSLTNKNYFNLIRNEFQNEIINRDNTTITNSSNLLFNFYTSTKYIISKNEPLLGYNKISSSNSINLYENNDVLPFAYHSNKIMSKREYETLAYPYNLDALLNYIVVDKSLDNVYQPNIKKYNGTYTISEINNITYELENNHYLIEAEKNNKLTIKLDNPIKDKILFIKFKMNKAKDGYACSSNITINNITNALSCNNWKYNNNNDTFEYVISSNNQVDTLDIIFTEDSFDLSDFEFYVLDYNVLKNIRTSLTEIKWDLSNKKLSGIIEAKSDGIIKVNIPYEKKGFKVYVDDIKVPIMKIDDSLLGFNITKGTHKILITYNPPLYKEGLILSLIGVICLNLVIFYKKLSKPLNIIKKISIKYFSKTFRFIKKFIKNNKEYIYLFISLFILDLSLRLFYNKSVGFYHWYNLVPNLFSFIWISFILSITKILGKTKGRIFYIIYYTFTFILFIVNAIYFSYFNQFFDYSILSVAGEGLDYYETVLLNIKYWVVIIAIISIYLNIKGLKSIEYSNKFNYKKFIQILIIFIALKMVCPIFLGTTRKEVEWDDWRSSRSIYNTFNDNNKSMMVSGLFEYNIRNFYVNYIRNNSRLLEDEEKVLKENFNNISLSEPNNYTGLFKGKNLILVQLESIDEFLLNKDIMPNFYKLSKNSINFTKHYSFTSGGGSTFNSEFMVNTGYSSAYNYNQSAYTFSRNTYSYSLPNLFKKEGYTVNAFHMNSSEYYSRGVNYKAFGYDSYNGLKDLNIYKNKEYELDRELINNETFKQKIFPINKPFVSSIITYTAHMPYKTTAGTCPKLTDEKGLTELECLKIQAKETDYFIKLLMNNLKEYNLIDNTVVVLFSDHYIYTLENKSLLDKYKNTTTNLINQTPFIIYSNGEIIKNINKVNSQLDILPTILNLFGIEYYPNNYIGKDILSSKYDPIVFFNDGSWYNGSTYVTNGEYYSGKKINNKTLEKYNRIVKKRMLLNDAVIKSDYFNAK